MENSKLLLDTERIDGLLKEKLRRFMMGRYGVDQLNRFILGVALVMMIISMFVGRTVFYTISLLLLIITYARMLSRNHGKRFQENNRYLNIKNRFLGLFRKQQYMAGQRKIYHIYRCPGCRQKIRIPKGKGRISISCPKCRREFIKKS